MPSEHEYAGVVHEDLKNQSFLTMMVWIEQKTELRKINISGIASPIIPDAALQGVQQSVSVIRVRFCYCMRILWRSVNNLNFYILKINTCSAGHSCALPSCTKGREKAVFSIQQEMGWKCLLSGDELQQGWKIILILSFSECYCGCQIFGLLFSPVINQSAGWWHISFPRERITSAFSYVILRK